MVYGLNDEIDELELVDVTDAEQIDDMYILTQKIHMKIVIIYVI